MSDTMILGKRRTIRFSADVDRKLERKAANSRQSVSMVIRNSVEQELASEEMSAGEWILAIAKTPAKKRPLDAFDKQFRERYLQRHKQ